MTIGKAIDNFINSQMNKTEKELCENMISLIFLGYENYKDLPIEDFDIFGRQDKFLSERYYDTIIEYMADKQEFANRIARFIEYLNERYDFKQKWEDINGDIVPFKGIERKLKMLKVLQGENPKNIDELARDFAIQPRNLKDDLNSLETGIKFLGQEMKLEITREGRNKKYLSTIHPVFLPFNMEQAFFYTYGIKQIAIKLSPSENQMMNQLADMIYSQLSDYAKSIISKNIDLNDKNQIEFNESSNRFVKEQESHQYNDRIGLNNKIIHLAKSGSSCLVKLANGESINALRLKKNFTTNTLSLIIKGKKEEVPILEEDIIDIDFNYK